MSDAIQAEIDRLRAVEAQLMKEAQLARLRANEHERLRPMTRLERFFGRKFYRDDW